MRETTVTSLSNAPPRKATSAPDSPERSDLQQLAGQHADAAPDPVHDSTFGLEPTDPITLHINGVTGSIASKPAVPVFDDPGRERRQTGQPGERPRCSEVTVR
jgi:hypothetical protein